MQIDRSRLRDAVAAALRRSRGVVLVGPRQVGKTTLVRSFVPAESSNYLDLEDPRVEAQFEAPLTALERLRGLVVIDEVQRAPDLFNILRVLIDREAAPAKFLLLGSASPALLRQSSESLAGRVEVMEIGGFTLDEVGVKTQSSLWSRGGYPRSYLAASDEESRQWRESFIRLFLEQMLRIAAPDDAYFWATHAGAELDLLMFKDGRRVGVEFKRMDAPRLTPSMRTAMKDLRLEALYVVYPGSRRYALAERVEAVPLGARVGPEKAIGTKRKS